MFPCNPYGASLSILIACATRISPARPVDIIDYTESTDPHCQRSLRQITETSHRRKQVYSHRHSPIENEKEPTDSFHYIAIATRDQTQVIMVLCCHHPLGRVGGFFTLNWAPTNTTGKPQKDTFFRIIHMALKSNRHNLNNKFIYIIIDYIFCAARGASSRQNAQWI